MSGAVICKSNGEIILLSTGTYSDLESKMDYFSRIAVGKQVRLVKTDNINMAEVLQDQSLIEEKFKDQFN